jgi:hypothetical protein
LGLSQNSNLFVERPDLLVFLFTNSPEIGFVDVNDFNGDDLSGGSLAAVYSVSSPKLEMEFFRTYPLYTLPKEPFPINSSKVYSGIATLLLLHRAVTFASCSFAIRIACRW